MHDIFSPQGRSSLKLISKMKTIYCFDFDGTLASIVSSPADVKLKESTKKLLKEIKSHFPIAIISGRSIFDLKKLLDFEPDFLIGNHGLEGIKTEQNFLDEYKITLVLQT